MRRMISIAAAAALAGCNMAGELNPSTQAQLNNALALACPWIALHPVIPIDWPNGARTAFYTAMQFCPPNPPPTNAIQIAAMIAAAATLAPYIHRRYT